MGTVTKNYQYGYNQGSINENFITYSNTSSSVEWIVSVTANMGVAGSGVVYNAGNTVTGTGEPIDVTLSCGNSSTIKTITKIVGREGSNGEYYPIYDNCDFYTFTFDKKIEVKANSSVTIKIQKSYGNVLVYGHWNPNSNRYCATVSTTNKGDGCIISFNTDGGNLSSTSVETNVNDTITLPTPTREGYEFLGWKSNLIDVAPITNGYTVNSTTGTVYQDSNYGATIDLIPITPGALYTSNVNLCGVYTYFSDGEFTGQRYCNGTTICQLPDDNEEYIRIELVCDSRTDYESIASQISRISFTTTMPSGTVFKVVGNQTLTAQWKPKNLVSIYNGTEWKKAVPYIFDGTSWRESQVNIYNGTDWKIVSDN